MYVTGFRLVVVVLVLCCLCLSETAAKQTLRGIVVDAETGVSLVGANVTNGDVGVVTDVTGKFSLSVVSGDSIVVTFVGFQQVVIPAARDLQPLTVRMHLTRCLLRSRCSIKRNSLLVALATCMT